MSKTFTLTVDHLTLVKNFYIDWNDYDDLGAPEVDPKRPYGDSEVLKSICRCLSWKLNKRGNYSAAQLKKAEKLHRETQFTLQIICLNAGGMVSPGTYELYDSCFPRSWNRKIKV